MHCGHDDDCSRYEIHRNPTDSDGRKWEELADHQPHYGEIKSRRIEFDGWLPPFPVPAIEMALRLSDASHMASVRRHNGISERKKVPP